MATGRERRAERLNERLRGAQRANVEDESFSLDIPGLIESRQAPSPAQQILEETPGRADDAQSVASQDLGTATRLPDRPHSDPYDLPNTSRESNGQLRVPSSNRSSSSRRRMSPRTRQRSGGALSTMSHPAEIPEEPETIPQLPSRVLPAMLSSPAHARLTESMMDEVEESPAHAPGSGKRRSIMSSGAAHSTARLHDVLNTDDAVPPSSSPLAKKARRSEAFAARPARRSRVSAMSRNTTNDDEDELSPDRPPARPARDDDDMSESLPIPSPNETQPRPESLENESPEHEAADEIGAIEAAKTLGRKRPRSRSLELGSGDVEEPGEPEDRPPPKKRGRKPKASPAKQKHPAPKPRAKQTATEVEAPAEAPAKLPTKAPAKARPKPKDPTEGRQKQIDDDPDDNTIEITVQRFINNKRRDDDDGTADPLHANIPFANRAGETVVDVFAQVCEEIIATTTEQFHELATNAADAAKKKEYRIKLRAVEAFREELSSRLLQHTIHLNHWYSLRKRVRHVQKEKLSLREDIIRLQGEREQVALRMDAIRIKHEADNKDSTYRLSTSALMQDIDLAVEQGREAPELPRSKQKQAELANLELLVSRVCEEASSSSYTGGLLNQVKSFNAFLERAATALESR